MSTSSKIVAPAVLTVSALSPSTVDLKRTSPLSVEVSSPRDIDTRIEVIKRRDAFENDNAAFMLRWQAEDAAIRDRILTARNAIKGLKTPEQTLRDVAELCLALGSDGLRGELTLLKAARAYAAWRDDTALTRSHVRAVAPMALRHRLRRDPLDEAGSSARVGRVVEDVLG